jgi:hypothetical protein
MRCTHRWDVTRTSMKSDGPGSSPAGDHSTSIPRVMGRKRGTMAAWGCVFGRRGLVCVMTVLVLAAYVYAKWVAGAWVHIYMGYRFPS